MLEDSLQCAAIIVYGVMTESAKKKPLLGGYLAQLQDARGRERYLEKLAVIGGIGRMTLSCGLLHVRARGNVPGVIS